MGLSVGSMSSEELAKRERSYANVWARIIRESGFEAK